MRGARKKTVKETWENHKSGGKSRGEGRKKKRGPAMHAKWGRKGGGEFKAGGLSQA